MISLGAIVRLLSKDWIVTWLISLEMTMADAAKLPICAEKTWVRRSVKSLAIKLWWKLLKEEWIKFQWGAIGGTGYSNSPWDVWPVSPGFMGDNSSGWSCNVLGKGGAASEGAWGLRASSKGGVVESGGRTSSSSEGIRSNWAYVRHFRILEKNVRTSVCIFSQSFLGGKIGGLEESNGCEMWGRKQGKKARVEGIRTADSPQQFRRNRCEGGHGSVRRFTTEGQRGWRTTRSTQVGILWDFCLVGFNE